MGSCAGHRETAEGEARRFGKAAEYADAMRLVRPHSMSALAAFLHSVSFHLLLLEFWSLSCCRLSSGSKRRSVRFGPPLEQYRTLVVFIRVLVLLAAVRMQYLPIRLVQVLTPASESRPYQQSPPPGPTCLFLPRVCFRGSTCSSP